MAKKPALITSTTLGAKLSTTALGWTLIQEAGHLPAERTFGDPLEQMLAEIPAGEHVDLVCYSDDISFAQSQAAKDGLTREEHIELVSNLCKQLQLNDRSASIKWITVKP